MSYDSYRYAPDQVLSDKELDDYIFMMLSDLDLPRERVPENGSLVESDYEPSDELFLAEDEDILGY